MKRTIAFLVCFMLCVNNARAWGPIAHYLIAVHNYNGTVAQYANIPDAWPSSGWAGGLDISVTPYFCWSHGVIDNGTIPMPWNESIANIPATPAEYPSGQQIEPGGILELLTENKLDFNKSDSAYSPEKYWGLKADAQNLYKGIKSHNNADSFVHWEYFMGPIDGQTNQEKRESWTIHHALKESWAEYELAAQILMNKISLTYDDFDSNGGLKWERRIPTGNGQFTTVPIPVPNLSIADLDSNNYNNPKMRSMVRLLRLSQAVYNKNRVKRSNVSGAYGIDVQSIELITTIIKNKNEYLKGYPNASSWTMWEVTMTRDDGSTTNLQLNLYPGEVTIQLSSNSSDTIVHEYEDPENQKIDWLLLKTLEVQYANQQDPTKRWDIEELLAKYTTAITLPSSN